MRNKTFDWMAAPVLLLLCAVTLYPFFYAFLYSVSDGVKAMTQDIVFAPIGFTLDNYKTVLADKRILDALFISVARTVAGTVLFLIVTGLCAYAMSKKALIGRKLMFLFFVIPMYVNAGLLPTYVLYHDLKLLNNFLVFILPGAFGLFYMVLMKVFFESIPDSLEESAKLDGAGDFTVFLKIYIPLSPPIIATMSLFVGVNQWNAWFDALLFITDGKLYPLQLLLQNVLKENQLSSYMQIFEQSTLQQKKISTETLKMAILMLTTLPIVCVYPFAQKYFVKGVMLGAVKL